MAWLQAIDTALFRFINQSLANPVFDWLMPILADGPKAGGIAVFVPIVTAIALGFLFAGGRRGRLFAIFIALVIICGDTFVIKTLKQTVGRSRPFITLGNEVLRIGGTDSGSMPSSHSANWFAAAMVAFIFYRRSWRFMVPMAAAVAYSRVYNGVHYPSDVLVGAVVGAGYAAAAVWSADALWRWMGRKWFPLWWQRMPSLMRPDETVPASALGGPPTGTAGPDSERQWLRLGYVLLGALLLFRLAYIASSGLELENDEAYQWIWSKHLALSYYSKPPMIAYAQFFGTSLWGDTEFGVRFLSPVISFVLSLLMLRFFAREASARLGLLFVLITSTTPLLAVGATLLTVDPLNVLFWTASMLAGWRAVQPDGKTSQWLWMGLWMGLGFLSKYTSLFQLACWALFFILWPPARAHLRRSGPYLALVVNVLCMTPVLIWNAQRDWITVTHVGDRADFGSAFSLTTRYVFDFLGTELAVLNPVFFIMMIWAAIAFWRSQRRDARLVYFFSMGAPVFIGYFLQSLHARVLPNWIAPAVLPLFALMLLYWDRRESPAARRWLKAGLWFGLVAVVLLHNTNLVRKVAGRPLPVRYDPLHRVRGWHEVARIAGEARRHLETEGRPTFIICRHYSYTSQITFYLPEAKAQVRGLPLVYYEEKPEPDNQFYFLPNYRYRQRKGDNAIFLDELERPKKDDGPPPQPMQPPADLLQQFATVKSLGVFSAGYKGQPIWWFQMWECRDQR